MKNDIAIEILKKHQLKNTNHSKRMNSRHGGHWLDTNVGFRIVRVI